jgi:hypothetical protein
MVKIIGGKGKGPETPILHDGDLGPEDFFERLADIPASDLYQDDDIDPYTGEPWGEPKAKEPDWKDHFAQEFGKWIGIPDGAKITYLDQRNWHEDWAYSSYTAGTDYYSEIEYRYKTKEGEEVFKTYSGGAMDFIQGLILGR